MEAFSAVPLWDLSQPNHLSTISDDDFLAYLSKEFPASADPTAAGAAAPTVFSTAAAAPAQDGDGINPRALGAFPTPGHATPPLTDDSSPSPPSTTNELASRRVSVSGGDSSLKRKASLDDFRSDDDDDRRNPADSPRKSVSSTSQKVRKPGQKDEARLMRRKEQNRAAQRAFRERKEKHVKDLEDKVAALEDAQKAKDSENENLRDLLTRLQEENQVLKRTAFTFQVPHGGNASTSATHPPAQAGPSTAPTPPAPQPVASTSGTSSVTGAGHGGDIDWNSLTTFDPAALSMLDDPTDVTMDFSPTVTGPGMPARTPYKTIASNPMFMSFAEPFSGWDGPSLSSMNARQGSDSSLDSAAADPGSSGLFDFNGFHAWSDGSPGAGSAWSPSAGGVGSGSGTHSSIEEMLGMAQPMAVDMALSPVSHHPSRHNSSASGSGSSSAAGVPGPFSFTGAPPVQSPGAMSMLGSEPGTTPSSGSSSGGSPSLPAGLVHSPQTCPRTKADFAARIASEIKSPFGPDAAVASAVGGGASASPRAGDGAAAVQKTTDGLTGGAQITCQGSVFPKTTKSEANIEVLAAWRSITSDPKFRDVDINELCAEFTNKAKCDGTKVVLEPQGVSQIIERFSRA